MKAQAKIFWLFPLLLSMNLKLCAAAPVPDKMSLCDLQRTAKQGEHRSVQVSGIYSNGFEMGVLTDSACPMEHTWVELDLQSTVNKEMLKSMMDTAGEATVVFDGEFYGPGTPDPNLPEAIRKSYKPGWGHLGAFPTKLVVHSIKSVKPASADHPASASLIQQVPVLQEAAMPIYPPIGRAAHITGKVAVEVTVNSGKITGADVQSGNRLLANATVANLKTWRFDDTVNDQFTVTYTYQISGEPTDGPTNPKVEVLPSLDVNITARPIKPTCNDCGAPPMKVLPRK